MGKYDVAIAAALQGDFKTVDRSLRKISKVTALKSTRERKYAAYKREMRDEMIGMPWRDLPLKKRAMFTAKYEWDPDKGKYGKYVKRKTPLSPAAVFKRMKEQSKRMARMGKRIGKQGARARKRYRPLAASIDMEGL